MKLNVLKPSVNNMAVRVFMRAANLDHTEDDAWGKTRSPEFLDKNPAHLTPMLETEDLPKGCIFESCAIMQYLCNKHDIAALYPKAPEQRVMVDSAMFYITGTLYPLVARATYPALGFPLYPGEVGASDADANAKAAAQKAAAVAVGEPLEVFPRFYMNGKPFVGGDSPSIADIRLASTLEFLRAIDYPLPAWASAFMQGIEASLGQAYAEPAADVRGYIAHVKSQKN